MLLAFSGWKPWMLLNILQCTKQPLAAKNSLIQNVSRAEVEQSWFRDNAGQVSGIKWAGTEPAIAVTTKWLVQCG